MPKTNFSPWKLFLTPLLLFEFFFSLWVYTWPTPKNRSLGSLSIPQNQQKFCGGSAPAPPLYTYIHKIKYKHVYYSIKNCSYVGHFINFCGNKNDLYLFDRFHKTFILIWISPEIVYIQRDKYCRTLSKYSEYSNY